MLHHHRAKFDTSPGIVSSTHQLPPICCYALVWVIVKRKSDVETFNKLRSFYHSVSLTTKMSTHTPNCAMIWCWNWMTLYDTLLFWFQNEVTLFNKCRRKTTEHYSYTESRQAAVTSCRKGLPFWDSTLVAVQSSCSGEVCKTWTFHICWNLGRVCSFSPGFSEDSRVCIRIVWSGTVLPVWSRSSESYHHPKYRY